jgi:hypothetical protein
MSAEGAEAKAAADAQVVAIEAQVAELKLAQAAAQKEADRLEEANNNSQALSRLADEIAEAKNASDSVIEGLVATQERIFDEILAREEGYNQMYADAERLRHEAEIEWDEAAAEPKWAAYDAVEAAIEQAYQDDDDQHRLLQEYDYNIRQVRNSFRITKAQLIAERTNAELMVAIKQEMNMGEDIVDLGAAKEALQAKLDAESDSTKQQVYTKEIGDLGERLVQIAQDKGKLAAVIARLTSRVTEADAEALTIGATINEEEAAIALQQQNQFL